MTYRTIEQELAASGHSFFQTVGDSMEPLLHNRKSTVVIAAKQKRLGRYDVALYHRPTGEYVLHRVIDVLDDAYVIRGDNRIRNEIVPEEQVIGVMTHYYPTEDGEPISCESSVYQNYVKTLPLRHSFLKIRAFFGKICRKAVSFIQKLKADKKTL